MRVGVARASAIFLWVDSAPELLPSPRKATLDRLPLSCFQEVWELIRISYLLCGSPFNSNTILKSAAQIFSPQRHLQTSELGLEGIKAWVSFQVHWKTSNWRPILTPQVYQRFVFPQRQQSQRLLLLLVSLFLSTFQICFHCTDLTNHMDWKCWPVLWKAGDESSWHTVGTETETALGEKAESGVWSQANSGCGWTMTKVVQFGQQEEKAESHP